MTDITVSEITDTTEITDPKIQAIVDRVITTVKLATEKAIAHQAEPATYRIGADTTSLEHLVLARFQQLRPEAQQRTIAKVMPIVKAGNATRGAALKDLTAVNLQLDTPVEAQVRSLPFPATLKLPTEYLQHLSQVRGTLIAERSGLRPQQNPGMLEFRLLGVQCMEETDEAGADSISIGGSIVDESGDTNQIAPFGVGEFHSGTAVPYAPPKVFTSFSLQEGTDWPKSYFVTLVLAERDWGGVSEFVQKLFEKVKGAVISSLTAAIGGLIGISGGPVGVIIGTAVGYAVGEIFNWFKDLWGDEIFKPVTIHANINGPQTNFAGNASTSGHFVQWKGFGGQYRAYYDWRVRWTNETVDEPEAITAGLGAASWSPGRLDFFVRGLDATIAHKAFQGGWSGWDSIGGSLTSAPAAVSWGPNRIDVVARGQDNALWHRAFDGSPWSPWTSLGGTLTSSPAICSAELGRLDIFARGQDNAIWHRAYQNGWTGWDSIGGNCSSAPAAVSWGKNRIDVVVRGQDHALWHRAYANNRWYDWETLGGVLTSAPTICSWAPGRLDVFARGQDNAVWHRAFDNNTWHGWDSIGGIITAAPAAVSWAANRIDVIVRGTDYALNHCAYADGRWHPWENLGGILL